MLSLCVLSASVKYDLHYVVPVCGDAAAKDMMNMAVMVRELAWHITWRFPPSLLGKQPRLFFRMIFWLRELHRNIFKTQFGGYTTVLFPS